MACYYSNGYTWYIHFKSPFQLLTRTGTGSDSDSEQKLFEINPTVAVGVECTKNVFAELVGGARFEEHFVDFDEFIFRQLAVGTIILKAFVPISNLFLGVAGILHQKLHIIVS